MDIKTVGIIGLGALGIMYGDFLTGKIGKENVFIIADEKRIDKYRNNGVYSNNKLCDFNYINKGNKALKLDLLIFTVKFNSLHEAIEDVKNFVGDNTIILSLLNGISSEEIIGQALGVEKVIYSTVQGMDCVKVDNKLTYVNRGYITFGEKDNKVTEKVKALSKFFDRVEFKYEIPEDMISRLWGKLLLNTGVNQAVAVFETNYGGVQREGKPREIMIGAMKEVYDIAIKENIKLRQNEIEWWLKILGTLSPEGKPSLRQDTEAHRKTEVELFAGTIIKLGKKHNIETPYNDFLYEEIKKIERSYLKKVRTI